MEASSLVYREPSSYQDLTGAVAAFLAMGNQEWITPTEPVQAVVEAAHSPLRMCAETADAEATPPLVQEALEARMTVAGLPGTR